MKTRLIAAALMTVLATAAWGQQGQGEAPAKPKPLEPGQKWIHFMGNLSNEKGRAELIELMKRGKKAGYNGVQVNDSKFHKYQTQPESYAKAVADVRKAFADNGMQFIAGTAAFGYSAEMLTHDPNLAEGTPVENAPFVVKGGKIVPDDPIALKNGDFEDFKGDEARGWQGNEPGKVTFVDQDVKHGGKASIRIENPGAVKGHGRIGQRISVKPFQYYHLSAWVKTDGWTGKDNRYGALFGNNQRWCSWMPPALKETQDWTEMHAVFNTFDNTEVTVYLGTWGGKAGKMWIDDFKIEPAGFVNVIRRDDAPLKITSEDGKTVFAEGKDFSVVKDPELLMDQGRPGYFTVWHKAPEVTVPAGSALKDGQKLLVSFEHILTGSKSHQINICMATPKTYEVLAKEMKWIKDTMNPDVWFLHHDEIRHMGWDHACVATGKTPGQILADNIKKCVDIVSKTDPGKPVIVWNDMFDPTHNAAKEDAGGKPFIMYLVKGDGPWHGSWEGMPKELGVLNWSHRANSAKFFSERGQQQILSDSTPAGIAKWLKESGQEPGVVGIQYTNWDRNYDKLEAYIDAVKAWEKETGGFKK